VKNGFGIEGKKEAFHKPRDKCGIFAVINYQGPGKAALLTYLGLIALQHRGQESAGMAFKIGARIELIKGMGPVERVFNREILESIASPSVLGHVRYSTTGSSYPTNAQPLVARSVDRSAIALAHNGNLTNYEVLHRELLHNGHIFHTTSDTEILLGLLFRFRHEGAVRAVKKAMHTVEGAYAAVLMDDKQVTAFRDPHGFRPLVIGCLNGAHIFASETAALDTIGASFIREIDPGEIVTAGPEGLSSIKISSATRSSFCAFEYVYFARPDSVINGTNVHEARKTVGALLAARVSADLDMVIPSPDSGVSAAMGLAEALNLPLEWAVHRNPYLGRTFIRPTREEREMAVRLKFNPIGNLVRGKKVAVVDDSIVRGTTSRILTSLLMAAGAEEIHICIASPPYINPCYYGIDIPIAEELITLDSDNDRLAKSLGANSITFSAPEDLYRAIGLEKTALCTACFTGVYPESSSESEAGKSGTLKSDNSCP